MLQDEETKRIKAELKWLAGQLAPARDLDVFLAEGIDSGDGPPLQAKGWPALQEELRASRRKAFEEAHDVVRSTRYRKLLSDLRLWLEGGEWRNDRHEDRRACRERPIGAFANRVLSARTKKLVAKTKKLKELTETERHRFRIALKKLRYASEFFEELYPGRRKSARAKTFQAALRNFQNRLGELNDIAVQEKFAISLLHSPPFELAGDLSERAFAIGVISGRRQSRVKPAMRSAVKAAAAFAGAKPFWRKP
jgi:CHAD domain-containing protein